MGLLGGYCETDEERAAIEQRDREYVEAAQAADRIAELEALLYEAYNFIGVVFDDEKRMRERIDKALGR